MSNKSNKDKVLDGVKKVKAAPDLTALKKVVNNLSEKGRSSKEVNKAVFDRTEELVKAGLS